MKHKTVRPALFLAGSVFMLSCSERNHDEHPNILLIVADDLGLGDVGVYGSRAIRTPNIDALAESGIRFDNAYATSATSTPSRFAMLTGLYPWRNPDAKILPGDAPLLIPTDIPTMPKMFQEAGYVTGAVGKWHLGMGDGDVDWNREITPSANDIGFDYSCLIAATNDRVPTVYVENGLVENLDASDPIQVSYEQNFPGEPTALSHPDMLKMDWSHGHSNSIVNGIPRIGFMKGGEKAKWVDEDMADYFVGKVKRFLDRNGTEPFFLYYGLHEPHVPRAPHQRFAGATGLGPRGDAVVEADWCVGEIVSYLRDNGLLENTIIIFTSDNGPVIDDGYKDGASELLGNHNPMNGLRGGKYSLFDGGAHIPLIVYWEKHTKRQVSDALVSQLDFFASLGSLVSADLPEGLDSENILPAFLGKSGHGRDALVLEAGGRLAYKRGDYTLIPPYKGNERNATGNELGNLPEWALFDLDADPAQTNDISDSMPEILDSLKYEFIKITHIQE